ncbi:MAG: DUF6538 domain-containing protein [Ensifer adhaerens]
MCTYLEAVGRTYYFRRVVPKERRAFILTATGKPRTEFKISLRTKDREAAKRKLPDYVKMSDREFDAARTKFAASNQQTGVTSPTPSNGIDPWEGEPPRDCRRPQLLRGRAYDEQDNQQVCT